MRCGPACRDVRCARRRLEQWQDDMDDARREPRLPGGGRRDGRTCRDARHARTVSLCMSLFSRRDTARVRSSALRNSPRASTAEAPQGWETAQVRYVLLAYPLGVRWALTCLSGTYFQNAVERVVKRAATEPNVAALVLTTTADQFTSAAVRRPSHAVILYMDHLPRIYARVQRPAPRLASAGPLFCDARGARLARRRAPRMVH